MLATSRFSPMGLRLLRHGDGLVDVEDILHAESGAGTAVLPRVLPAVLQQGDALAPARIWDLFSCHPSKVASLVAFGILAAICITATTKESFYRKNKRIR